MPVLATQPPRPCRSMTTSPGTVREFSSSAMTFSGGGGASRSKIASVGAGVGRKTDGSGSAMRGESTVATDAEVDPALRHAGARITGLPALTAYDEKLIVVVVGLLALVGDEGLFLGDVGRQDATDVLDLLVLEILFEVVLEIHLF